MRYALPPVYPITDKKLAKKTNHLSIVRELVRGGARLVQIRDKDTPEREFLYDLKRCVEFASRNGVTLIVNDRCDLALSSGAAGVHLGQDDLPPVAARIILGPLKIIGFSTHSILQVRKARRLPLQYIGFGPVYPTSTKDSLFPALGLSGLTRACEESSVPVVAIGGIGLEQISEVLKAGAASVGVISALMQERNLARQMECFLDKAMGR